VAVGRGERPQVKTNAFSLATDIIFSDFAASDFELAFEGQVLFFELVRLTGSGVVIVSSLPPPGCPFQAGENKGLARQPMKR
jgi:hypothetical protein